MSTHHFGPQINVVIFSWRHEETILLAQHCLVRHPQCHYKPCLILKGTCYTMISLRWCAKDMGPPKLYYKTNRKIQLSSVIHSMNIEIFTPLDKYDALLMYEGIKFRPSGELNLPSQADSGRSWHLKSRWDLQLHRWRAEQALRRRSFPYTVRWKCRLTWWTLCNSSALSRNCTGVLSTTAQCSNLFNMMWRHQISMIHLGEHYKICGDYWTKKTQSKSKGIKQSGF